MLMRCLPRHDARRLSLVVARFSSRRSRLYVYGSVALDFGVILMPPLRRSLFQPSSLFLNIFVLF